MIVNIILCKHNNFDKRTVDAIDRVGIKIKTLPVFSFLVNNNDKIKTYNLNNRNKRIFLNNDFFVIVASDSPVNNSILANTLNLVDYSIFAKNLYRNEIPILIVYKDDGKYIYKYSKPFEIFFD